MRASLLLAAAMLTACSMQKAAPVATERPGAPVPAPAGTVRDGAASWTADPRWPARAAEMGRAADAAVANAAAELGFAFERGREPVVAFDPAAPGRGDVTVKFVDGVRRPVMRVPPHGLLSGEFSAESDVKVLVAEGAIVLGAGEREPPEWFRRGAPIVAAGAFERRLRQQMIAGPGVLAADASVFTGADGDALAAAVRVLALRRIARTERPLARFLTVFADGASESAAIAALGIGGREFLDAATETDRAGALLELAADPVLPALRTARAALVTGDAGSADAALAPVATALTGSASDAWLVADARLCLAEIALRRGDTKNAAASLAAARATSKVLRVREARIVEAAVAAPADRPALLRALAADWPDALSSPAIAALVPVPDAAASKYPTLRADIVSADASARRAAAARLGESGTRDAAPALRSLAADGDATVRRTAIAGLALVLGNAADDDVENATKDADAAVRRTALDLLAVSNRARAAKRAAAMKDDPDPGVRARAVELSRLK